MKKDKHITTSLRVLFVGAIFFTLTSCSSFSMDNYLPDKKVEYKKSEKVGVDLEVPPDLTNVRAGSELYVPEASNGAGVATYSQFVGQKNGGNRNALNQNNIMPKVDDIRLEREGNERWLVINSSPQLVWPNVVSFWQDNGILLIEQDPTVGIMKTGWLENRADIKSDFITNNIRKFFDGIYSTSTRDQYRVRLEEGEVPGTTELYLTHFGMEEVYDSANSSSNSDRTVWTPRGSDVSLEAEMLRRLMIHLGVKEKRAGSLITSKGKQRTQRSELIHNARESKLLISEGFAKSWRLTGLALDRVGFAVEDRDRSNGLYYVRYNDPMADVETNESWLSKLNFWSGSNKEELDDRYQILVQSGDDKTLVVVLDEQGNELFTETATRILTLIHEQIK